LTLLQFSIILSDVNPLNLYSVPLMLLVIILLAGSLLLRGGPSRGRVAILLALVIGLVVGWFTIRPVQTPTEGAEELRNRIGAGNPVLLEFQSPY
jgi:O-antigen ligase